MFKFSKPVIVQEEERSHNGKREIGPQRKSVVSLQTTDTTTTDTTTTDTTTTDTTTTDTTTTDTETTDTTTTTATTTTDTAETTQEATDAGQNKETVWSTIVIIVGIVVACIIVIAFGVGLYKSYKKGDLRGGANIVKEASIGSNVMKASSSEVRESVPSIIDEEVSSILTNISQL